MSGLAAESSADMHTFYNIRREWKQVGFERIYAHRYGIRLLYRSKRKIGSLLPCCADTFLPFLLRTNADKLRSRAKRDGDSDTGDMLRSALSVLHERVSRSWATWRCSLKHGLCKMFSINPVSYTHLTLPTKA